MTVKQLGRPSKASERIAEILQATVHVVARDGMAGVTFAKVADAAGMQRTLVLHYFASREQLISAFIDHAVGAIGTEILHRRPKETPLRQRIPEIFRPGTYRSREELVVWIELVALSARDSTVRQHMRNLWNERWLPDLEGQIAEAYPSAHNETVAASAYALACLFEAHWAFSLQNVVDETRQRQAERTALLILDNLAS